MRSRSNARGIEMHTKTPWAIGPEKRLVGDVQFMFINSNTSVGSAPDGYDDAAHIIKCVNAHDALVAALRTVYGALKRDALEPDTGGDVTIYRLDGGVMYQAINAVREALSAAGETP